MSILLDFETRSSTVDLQSVVEEEKALQIVEDLAALSEAELIGELENDEMLSRVLRTLPFALQSVTVNVLTTMKILSIVLRYLRSLDQEDTLMDVACSSALLKVASDLVTATTVDKQTAASAATLKKGKCAVSDLSAELFVATKIWFSSLEKETVIDGRELWYHLESILKSILLDHAELNNGIVETAATLREAMTGGPPTAADTVDPCVWQLYDTRLIEFRAKESQLQQQTDDVTDPTTSGLLQSDDSAKNDEHGESSNVCGRAGLACNPPREHCNHPCLERCAHVCGRCTVLVQHTCPACNDEKTIMCYQLHNPPKCRNMISYACNINDNHLVTGSMLHVAGG